MFIFHFEDGSDLCVPDFDSDCKHPFAWIPKLVFSGIQPDSFVCSVTYVEKEGDESEKND